MGVAPAEFNAAPTAAFRIACAATLAGTPALTARPGACEERHEAAKFLRPSSHRLRAANSRVAKRGRGFGSSPGTTPPAADRRPRRRGSPLHAQHLQRAARPPPRQPALVRRLGADRRLFRRCSSAARCRRRSASTNTRSSARRSRTAWRSATPRSPRRATASAPCRRPR